MAKPHITRTLGPIHFEDLDPHRFEDLVRQLVYDFRHWQSIEATGRGGADDGYDIRAYEIAPAPVASVDEDTAEDPPHPMEGNLWMIQCKREKKLGPQRVRDIIGESVKAEAPPYGYILAAPTHFSKPAHDAFREELITRGVMEFNMWGAGELEDMLYQPKNDHILFAFLGISLSSRRRARTTEIRSAIAIKNKLRRILGDEPDVKPVLLRDLQDIHYPYDQKYQDFAKRPRWKAYSAVEFDPLGLVVSQSRRFAYLNRRKGEWDCSMAVNCVTPVQLSIPENRSGTEQSEYNAVKFFWEQIPREFRVMLARNSLIRFDEIALVDEKGDTAYDCPHIFIDYRKDRGPFVGSYTFLEVSPYQTRSLEGLARIEFFPAEFQAPSFGVIHKDKLLSVDAKTRATLKNALHSITLYDVDGRYSFLKPSDVIGVDGSTDQAGKAVLLKITNVRVLDGSELLEAQGENPGLKEPLERQISRAIEPADRVRVVEALVVYDWQIEQNRPVI